MEPIKFDGVNVVFGANQPEYKPLPAERVGKPQTGQINTCWELSPDELKQIQETGKNLFGSIDVRTTIATRNYVR